MGQTKRKRRTKHRGNAAGKVEARGRTGRKPTAAESKASAREQARKRRVDRLDRPPSWRSAFNRAAIATIIFVAAVLLLFREQEPITVFSLALFMMVLYVPMGYYMDSFVYRRRQRRKALEAAARRTERERS
jgi:hypothetical protein